MRLFWRDERGVGAIEFALTAPMVGVFLFSILAGWSYYSQKREMRDAVEAAGKYYLQGGRKDATAQSIANDNWANKPSGGNISVSRICVCDSTSVSCITTTVCSSGTVSQMRMSIVANAVWTNPYTNPLTAIYYTARGSTDSGLQETEVVRVR